MKQASKFAEFLRLKNEAVSELLEQREQLELKLQENARQLLELGYSVKGSVDSSSKTGSDRLDDHEIRTALARLLKNKKLSIPQILPELNIARSRFNAFVKRNPTFLKSEGEYKSTKYTLA
jgi:hypothetical protein